ncbi:hypothetical protein PGT21_031298 [Puccinia graminis f. sp. tritici]|uniref:Uncharacterized protein n=1 Tax=Puccinia graminis f. sp. tritici TaxID=56615 RepID=A0A5B0P7B3_PUCGR|nr:hypothetical protein PGT21_031298 [Puccinia graminis f. sp. tritici]
MESDLTNIRREIRHLGKMYGSDHHMKLIGSLKQLYHYLFMEMGSTEESTYLNKWNELSKMLADRGKPDRNRPLVGGRLMFVLFLLGDYMKQYKPISSEFHKHIHIFQENNLSGIVKAFMEFRILSNWWFEPIDFIPTLELISNEALKPFSRFMKGLDKEVRYRAVFACLSAMMEFVEKKRDRWAKKQEFYEDFFDPFLESKDPYKMIQNHKTWDKMIRSGNKFFQKDNEFFQKSPGSLQEGTRLLETEVEKWCKLELVTVYCVLNFVKDYKEGDLTEAIKAEDRDDQELEKQKRFIKDHFRVKHRGQSSNKGKQSQLRASKKN